MLTVYNRKEVYILLLVIAYLLCIKFFTLFTFHSFKPPRQKDLNWWICGKHFWPFPLFFRSHIKKKYHSELWYQKIVRSELISIKDVLKLSLTNPLETLLVIRSSLLNFVAFIIFDFFRRKCSEDISEKLFLSWADIYRCQAKNWQTDS